MPFLHLDQLRLHYQEAGQGPAIVCLHGWASSARMWERTLSHLSDRLRVVALDLPGFGDSDKPADGYSIAYFAGIVRRFSTALGIEQAHLLGHSMGGAIAAYLALSWPHFVNRLILADAAITGRLAYGLHHALRTSFGRGLLMRSHGARLVSRWSRQNLERLGNPIMPLVGGLSGATLQRSLEDFSKTTVQSALGSLHAVMNSNLSSQVHLIRVPTLVIVGERDRTIPLSDSLLLAQRIPGAQLAIVPGASHLPMDEQPAAFDRLVAAFLAERTMDDRR